jgi:hypothetical protein
VSGLVFILTPLGRARLINPENTGTSGLRISHIGVSASAAGVVGGVLQGEIKRLTTFSGAVVADDTIHVTVRDDTTDVYTLRSFAIYFEDGALMGWYAQAGAILEKSPQAMLLLSGDIQFQNLDVTALTFGDSNWTNPIATTTVYGVLRLATNEVALAGASVVDAITPAGLFAVLNARFGLGAPSAFVKSLLGLATAALIRTALEIKSAALSEAADFATAGHGHAIAGIAGLQAALDGKQASGNYALVGHTHTIANVSGLQAALDGKQASGNYALVGHSHAAGDVTSGVFSVDRIPDLSQAKITGLTAALAAKAPTNAPTFTNGISLYGNYKIHDPVGGGVALEWGLGYSHASDGHGFIANRNPAGFLELFAGNGSNRLRVGPAAGLTYNDVPVWHQGNFNPGSKLDYRGNLEATAATTGNWNDATLTGWYRSSPGTPNAPEASQWYMGTVIRHDASWVEQVVRQFAGDPNIEYFRMNFGGAWSAWQRRYTNQAALDARYARHLQDVVFRDITAHRGNGTGVIFLNETQSRYLFFDATKYVLPGAGLEVGGTIVGTHLNASSSDARLKQDIADLGDCLEKLRRLRPRKWRWIESGQEDFGWVAQEYREAIPEGVHQSDEPYAGGEPLLSVRYGKAEPLIVGALLQIEERLAALERRFA